MHNINFSDLFLWVFRPENYWSLQYLLSFVVWGLAGGEAIYRLTVYKIKDELYSLSCLALASVYMPAKLYWLVYEASRHTKLIELTWSAFETACALVIIYSLYCRENHYCVKSKLVLRDRNAQSAP